MVQAERIIPQASPSQLREPRSDRLEVTVNSVPAGLLDDTPMPSLTKQDLCNKRLQNTDSDRIGFSFLETLGYGHRSRLKALIPSLLDKVSLILTINTIFFVLSTFEVELGHT